MELKMKHVGLQNPIKNMKASINMGSKINEKSNKSGCANSNKNPSKIYQKSMKMRSMGASWDDFGGIWAHVG